MRFLRTLAALAVTVCVALVLIAFAALGSSQSARRDRATAPAEVFMPFGWQADVNSSAPGPATVLVSGEGWGLRGINFKGKVAVVAESGVYRMQRYTKDVEAGEDVLLSPAGQIIADGSYADPGTGDPPLWFTDLTTGKTTKMTLIGTGRARPVAWSPDGRKLVAEVGQAPASGPWIGGRLELLDLGTGDVRVLAELGSTAVHRAQLAAFSPDGGQVAAQVGDALVVIDLANRTTRTLALLGADRRLAGTGAWDSAGARIAVVTLAGCSRDCDQSSLNARQWQIDELDTVTGAPVVGEYERLTALSVRVLGRLPNGELAVVKYHAYKELKADGAGRLSVDSREVEETDYRAVSGVTLLGLRPGGGDHRLLKLPGGATHVDVAANVIQSGRFDGRSARPMPLPAPAWVWVLLILLLLFLFSIVRQLRRAARG